MRQNILNHIFLVLGRSFTSILMIVCFTSDLSGQSADEQIIVTFKKQIFKKSLYCSEKLQVPKPIETPFIGLSGYIESEEFNGPIFVRTQTNGIWSNWEDFKRFHEQQAEGRITFEGDPLDEKVEFMQFKSYKKLDLPLNLRLFYPGHSKKKPNRQQSGVIPRVIVRNLNIAVEHAGAHLDLIVPKETLHRRM